MTDGRPLTPLEEYFLLEDRPAYPWSFFVRLGLAGCADRQAAEKALRHCVAWHPLLSSIARQQRDGSWIWQRIENPQPAVRWTTGTGGRKTRDWHLASDGNACVFAPTAGSQSHFFAASERLGPRTRRPRIWTSRQKSGSVCTLPQGPTARSSFSSSITPAATPAARSR
jgi:hypothetical protein